MAVSKPDLWTLRRADTILAEYVRHGEILASGDDLGVVRRLYGWCGTLLKHADQLPDQVKPADGLPEPSDAEATRVARELDEAQAGVLPFPKGRGSGWGTT